MVTSSTPGEGKTKVTLELAKALVLLGFRVLIVDGDFHKAKLSKDFGYAVPLQTNTSLKPVQISLGLDLLPAIPQPKYKEIEFIARGGFEKRLNAIQTSGKYDYVIVDSAPVSSTSETALMAQVITNVLLVVRLGVSDRYMVQETLEQLMRHNAQIIGLVLNGIEQRADKYIYKQDNLPVKS
jgi:polysaccharide biosynthesis transport protein